MTMPWNIAESQVYSFATYFDNRVNMITCTYVSLVSKNPRLYAIAIENQSRTFLNLLQERMAI